MITSVKNEKVKQWKKLHKRRERTQAGAFLVEGFHLVEEAVNSNWTVREVIIQEDVEQPSWTDSYPVVIVSENVMAHITQTTTPQGIIAVIESCEQTKRSGNHLLLIDSIQDPGNLGTIIRTADAAGMDGILLGDGTVDLYNDKVIRSTQGSIFHIPIFHANLEEVLSDLKEEGFSIWATALENASNYNDITPEGKVAIILGNEGAGVQAELIKQADRSVKIPIYGQAESLNVSIAAGILMYHLKR
ncbi:TrmH family RNA methyltransferase [Oceanobacillus polygoni]|uniref:TrmH family RNA methyltransferase n=1 Tax=Oceanobacillus polygoni TaxID=1235259 RepID=A0A9X0YUS9_9BACI|nr:RNA methyltransferase [Oceanobacillus polygoni]MBP2077386.1 TrmH family RNA methyltransferase [Oceanobacillus polygoni]